MGQRMQSKHLLIGTAIAALLATASPGAAAQAATESTTQSAAERQLIEQGRYWLQQRDSARAAETWKKLLQARPGSADALLGLGQASVQANQAAQAQAYLAQLRQLHPNHPDIPLLEQDIAMMGDGPAATLSQAHIFIRQENADEAIKHYQKLFNGREPQGKLGVEYYSVLGYTKNGWAEAVAGLERLQKRYPDDIQIPLALAKLWVLRNETRPQGLRTFATLSRRQDVGGDATEHWRQALSWLGAPPPPSTSQYFEEYLKANPDDDEIRQQYRAKRTASAGTASNARPAPVRVDPFDGHVKTGFDALQNADLATAERSFTAALRLRPRNASVLGGLGLVKLRQEKFAQASDLLGQASALGDAAQWKQALDSANYWDLVEKARTARQEDRLDDAAKLLEQALQIDAHEPTAAVELGRAYVDLQSPQDAERAYRAVLAREPGNLPALQGLVGVLAATNRGGEALDLIDGLSPELRERIDVSRLRAERSMAQGREADSRGDLADARSYFEDAISQSPSDPWLRLELARLLQRMGQHAEAIKVTDALLTQESGPGPESLYVAALVRAEQQDWTGALELADRIPQADRTSDMKALHARASLQAGLAQARALAQRGEQAQARAMLAPLVELAGGDAGSVSAIAATYADAGDSVRARALLREALTRERQPSAGLLLQYAGLLLRVGGSDADFANTMKSLSTMPLDAAQRQQYEDLRRGHGLRQAETLRQRGELALAYEALRPLLASMPNDPLVLGALARMYMDAGDEGEAVRLYERILARSPNDLDTLRAAGGAASAAGDLGTAERLFQRALQIAPDDPQVLAALGNIYRRQGRNNKALPLLRQAEAGLRRQLTGRPAMPSTLQSATARPGATAMPVIPADNPFATLAPRGNATVH